MTNRFLDKVIVSPLLNGKDWELQYEVRVTIKDGQVIYIPAGFITDFASIPWFFRRMFQPATGRHRRAALVHDYLFRTASEPFTFSECNTIFNNIMITDGTVEWKRKLIYNGVRFGGRSSYVDRV